MARTVKDLAIFLSVLAGTDPLDTVTAESNGKGATDYSKFLNLNALKGKRIGVERKFQGDNRQLIDLWQRNRDLLIQSGAEIIEIDYLDKINELGKSEFLVLKYEFKFGVNKYLAGSGSAMRSLTDVIAFNKANAGKAMPFFTQDTLEACEKTDGLNNKEYIEALAKSNTGSREIINSVMAEHKLDAITGLTMGPACSIDRWYGDRWGDVSLSTPAAISGYPHITVPCGQVYGLPVGLSFFSGAYTEPLLIALAYAFEQASKQRFQPAFKPAYE
jgi:amidase